MCARIPASLSTRTSRCEQYSFPSPPSQCSNARLITAPRGMSMGMGRHGQGECRGRGFTLSAGGSRLSILMDFTVFADGFPLLLVGGLHPLLRVASSFSLDRFVLPLAGEHLRGRAPSSPPADSHSFRERALLAPRVAGFIIPRAGFRSLRRCTLLLALAGFSLSFSLRWRASALFSGGLYSLLRRVPFLAGGLRSLRGEALLCWQAGVTLAVSGLYSILHQVHWRRRVQLRHGCSCV